MSTAATPQRGPPPSVHHCRTQPGDERNVSLTVTPSPSHCVDRGCLECPMTSFRSGDQILAICRPS
ncbi:hypothetical protein FOXYSP1_09016 [Fusarium oxysporum f. sp. phaseoli]